MWNKGKSDSAVQRNGWNCRMVLILGLLNLAPSLCGGQPSAGALSVEDWRADLHQMADHVRNKHRAPFHSIDQQSFEAAVASLDRRLSSLEPTAIVIEFARLLALVGDGHTRLTLPVNVENLGYEQGHTQDPEPTPTVPRFHTLPVRFGDFSEGLHISSATQTNADLIGARVFEIGDKPVEDALESIGALVAHDTDAGKRFQSIKVLSVPELLVEAGVSRSLERLRLVVSATDGSPKTVELSPIGYDQAPEWIYPIGRTPRKRDAPYFRIETLDDSTLVVRIYQINDSRDETLGSFARRLAQALDRHDPDKVVVDLRYCHGGDQSISRALVLPFVRWDKSTEPGHLFAMIGPETFSAAVNLASRLEEWTQVTFVGEPLGSGPTHYSSSDREILNHSNLVARVSTGYFVGWTGTESRKNVEIGVPVKPRIADTLAGKDTVLEAALAYRPATSVAAQIIQAHETAGINAALILWARYRTDPATAHRALENVGNAFGRHLLENEEFRYAAAIFLFNREFHPSSGDAYLGEAEAHHKSGNSQRALDIVELAERELAPDARFASLREKIERELEPR